MGEISVSPEWNMLINILPSLPSLCLCPLIFPLFSRFKNMNIMHLEREGGGVLFLDSDPAPMPPGFTAR